MNGKQLLSRTICRTAVMLSTVFCLGMSMNGYAQEDSVNWEERAAPAMETPFLNTDPLPEYGYDRLDYAMTIGIERTPGGRIWSCWVAGGDNEHAFFVLNRSDDDGETWSDPKLVIDPQNPELSETRRTIVGNLWTDPKGRLWLFFDQSMTYFDGRNGLWYTMTENPDDENPTWSEPERIWHGCALNKPIILEDGTWMLGVSLWDRGKIKNDVFKDAFHDLDSLRMANVLVSTDEGKTWKRRGGVKFNTPQFDEVQIVERKDGTLWMTGRTGKSGLHESVSHDQGRTWSTPEPFLPHRSTRHLLRRLASGHLLLIKHGDLDEQTTFRSKLTAFLSDDEGKTWKGGLLVDERRGVSYPDGFQAPDGTIYISYDRNREYDGEILMACFTEEDVLAGEFQSEQARSRVLISKPEGLDRVPKPSVVIHQQKQQ